MRHLFSIHLIFICGLFFNCVKEKKLSINNLYTDSLKNINVQSIRNINVYNRVNLMSEDTVYQKRIAFQKFISLIGNLNLPANFNSYDGWPDIEKSVSIDTYKDEIRKFAPKGMLRPYKKFAVNDSLIAIIHIVPSSTSLPYLSIHQKNGEFVTGINLFGNGGMDFNMITYNYITITKDLDIIVVDSTFRWKVDEENKRIESSKKVEAKLNKYQIQPSGIIKKL